jgi:phage baseplate assembly protein W
VTFILPANFRQLPPNYEMAQPFRVDATGAIAQDQDPMMWGRNHILAILLTNAGERVMRPNYGVGIYRMVWENDTPLIENQMITAANQQLAIYEPNIQIMELEFVQQPEYSGVMELQVAFTVAGIPQMYYVGFTLSGTSVEVSQ